MSMLNRRDTTTNATDEPEIVPAFRYTTLGGAEVWIYVDDGRVHIHCHGCDYDRDTQANLGQVSPWEKQDANTHATTCRAMPRPTSR